MCTHERISQLSTIEARTTWSRDPEGVYTPDESPCTKVRSEETHGWECLDCGAPVNVEDVEGGVRVE